LQPRISQLFLGLAALIVGCEDLREFKTSPDEVYLGEVIGSDSDPQAQSFIRKGFESHTILQLRFNPTAAGVIVTNDASSEGDHRTAPGLVNTYVCSDASSLCDDSLRTAGPLAHAPLLNIDGLAHDALSQYTFPGGGRLRNYIYGVRFSGQTSDGKVGRDALLFISLMETGHIEVRAIAPNVLADDGETEELPALFGVFDLTRTRI
jgi:hypothetical protein